MAGLCILLRADLRHHLMYREDKDSRIQGVKGSSEMLKNYVTVDRFNGFANMKSD